MRGTGVVDEWLTVEEAAALLKVSAKTIYRWCRVGELAHTRVSRTYRVSRADLERRLSAAMHPVPAAASPSSMSVGAARVIAIANQKGGAGKTTTTVNLGAALAELGCRVLIIDVDQQANATLALTGKVDVAPSLAEVLLEGYAPERAILATEQPNLQVLPSSMALANAEVQYAAAPGREFLLRPIIKQLQDDFDAILIDCPPSLGPMTVSALVAAGELLIPVAPQLFSMVGLRLFDQTVRMVQERIGHQELRLMGVLINRAPGQLRDGLPRTLAYRNVVTGLRDHYGNCILETVIPETSAIEEAHQAGIGLIRWRGSSPAAAAYRALAQEVMARGE